MEHMVQPMEHGVGGKFRRRLFRRASTPYDRPATATRPTRHHSWMSKLFDFGARRFFANKRLPDSTIRPPVEEQERINVLQETSTSAKSNSGLQEPVGDVCGTSSINNDTNGLQELEQLLKQKNFSRSEIDRLTELLKSRADAMPVKDDEHGFKLNPSGQESRRHQEFPTVNLNKSESSGAHGASHPAVTTREQNMQQHIEDRTASPADLAKAYMSSRPTNVSPSALGLRVQIARENSVPSSHSPYTLKSQLFSLPEKPSGYSGVPENGFSTPRSRGRSAMYNMGRTPYSRFNPVAHQKGSGSKNYGDSRPLLLASRPPSENGGQVASKPMALKRRSNVLDDEIGSIGPIRRIRQKHNLLSHGKDVTLSGRGLGSDLTQSPNRDFMSNADTRGPSSSNASYAHVPRESSEMAAKILEHLEKMTPKKKSLESKLAAAREGSTFKLAPHMLHGQALKSMEELDASRLLGNLQKDQKLVDQSVSRLPDFHEYTTQKEEQGHVKSVLPGDNLTPDRVVHGSNNSSLGYSAMLSFSSQPPEKKHPFKMSAHENWIEMDDDQCNEHGSESLGKGLKECLTDCKFALNEDKTLDNSPVLLESTHATPVLSRTELEGGNVLAGENKTGDKCSTSFAPNTSSQKVLSQSTEVGDSHILFSSGSAPTRNNPTSVESKFQTSSSLKNVFSGATNTVVGVTESDTNGTNNSELDNTVNGNLGKPPSLAFSSMPSSNIVSVDGPSTNDAPRSSSACFSFSSSGPASVNLSNQSFIISSSNMASSAGATNSTSPLSDSVIVPANVSSSNLSERISVSDNSFSKALLSAPSTIGRTEATDVKAQKVNGLGNFSNSSSVSTFAGMSTGFSIFGDGTSASSSAVYSQWPSSASGTSVSKLSSLTGSGSDTICLTSPVHFGSSSSSTGFGLSGVTPLTASISFGSSVPATKSEGTTQNSASASESDLVNSIDGAAPSFKFGSGASASESDQVNSINGAVPSFKFGGGASASPQGNAFGSADAALLATSQFSASFTTPASSSTSLFSFNACSSAPGVYSFNAGSSSSGTSVGNTTSGVFKFGAAPSVPSSSANAMTSSSSTAPSIFSFPASTPPSSSDSTKVGSSCLNSSTIASSLQAPTSSFVPPFTMPSSTGFSLGSFSSAFGTSNPSMGFGSNNGVPSNPTFSFTQSAGTQSVFGNSASPLTTTPGINYQMSAEDCMAEDPIQSSAPAAPVFGQSLVSPAPPGFMFGSTAPSPGAPFQFSQSQVGQQNPSQFQASSSLEFNAAGGSFSLGSSDKSGRKFVKVNRNRHRKMR